MRREYNMETINYALLPDGWHAVAPGTWDEDYFWDTDACVAGPVECKLGFAFWDTAGRGRGQTAA